MKILELFCGYGTASFALKALGIDYEIVGYSDIDKYANQCFQQNHGGKELGDCTKINPNDLEDFDLLTGGFPCQAFSVAGKGLGELDIRGTLFNEIIRIAEVKHPRYMLLENVKGLTNKNHKATYEKIKSELSRIGYYAKIKILNTKDYGIPQNRERIWFACFRNKEDFENFRFPEKEELKIFLKDILEDEVDEKYYLNNKQIERIINTKFNQAKTRIQTYISNTLCARDFKDPKCVKVYEVNGGENSDKMKSRYIQIDKGHHSQQDRYYNPNNISPTTVQNVPKIIDLYNKKIKENIVPTLSDPCHNNLRLLEPFIAASRSYPRTSTKEIDGERHQQLEPKTDGTTNTISTVQKDNYVIHNCITQAIGRAGSSSEYKTSCNKVFQSSMKIRKLTPKECFRLQGFLNDEVSLEGLSNTQQYKLAGNGQSVNVVKKIFERMFNEIL